MYVHAGILGGVWCALVGDWPDNAPMHSVQDEVAAAAARMVVEEGLEYGVAKRQAVKQLGAPARTALPSNEQVEVAVREYIDIFCADTQPQELKALRHLAALWMARLAEFRPHLSGAVWRGTATRLSDIYLQLFCDDPKSAEIRLIDQNVRYEVSSVHGFQGDEVDALSMVVRCDELGQRVGLHLMIYDHDDLRGALKPDGQGLSQRGDLKALERLMSEEQ